MKKLTLISLFLLTAFSCKKSFLVEDPKSILTPDNLYVNKAGFETGIYGLLNLVRRERQGIADPVNDLTITAAVIGVDNAFSNFPAGGAPEQVFNDFGVFLNPSNSYVRKVWEWLYLVINSANTIIDRSEQPGIVWTMAEKNRIVGEAKLIRAWAYRHLTYLYGDVPLTIHESTGSNIKTDWVRNSVYSVRKQMEEDLLFAETNLPTVIPATEEGRLTKGVATHFLSELYLALKDYSAAKTKAQSLINDPTYKLITNRYGVNASQPGTPFSDMFIEGNSLRSQGNTEVLWAFNNEYLSLGGDQNIMRRWWVNRYDRITINGKTPITFSIENGGRGIGRFAVTKYALALYDTSDDRGKIFSWRWYWIANNAASLPLGVKLGDTIRLDTSDIEQYNLYEWPNTRKWDWAPAIASDLQQSSNYNDQIYIRLAETYLILAESQFYLGDLNGAASTINILRARSKAKAIMPSQVTLDFILDERSRELVTEEHRRYTLLRTGTWYSRTKKYNNYATNKITLRDTILPIPQSVIDANLTKPMNQNNGY